MSRSMRGARQFQPLTRTRPPRAPAATFERTCIMESFDQVAEAPLGPDLVWSERHGASAEAASGSTVQSLVTTGTVSTRRVINVVGNGLALRAPDDSELTGTAIQWETAFGVARADSDLPDDMRVAATVTGLGPLGVAGTPSVFRNFRYELWARTRSDVALSTAATGWQVYFSAYNNGTSTVSMAFDTDDEFGDYIFDDPIADVQVGDELGIRVTGTGLASVVQALVNDVVVLELSGTDLSTFVSGLGIDPDADLPSGPRSIVALAGSANNPGAGTLSEGWDHGTMDDVVSVDDFSACSA